MITLNDEPKIGQDWVESTIESDVLLQNFITRMYSMRKQLNGIPVIETFVMTNKTVQIKGKIMKNWDEEYFIEITIKETGAHK